MPPTAPRQTYTWELCNLLLPHWTKNDSRLSDCLEVGHAIWPPGRSIPNSRYLKAFKSWEASGRRNSYFLPCKDLHKEHPSLPFTLLWQSCMSGWPDDKFCPGPLPALLNMCGSDKQPAPMADATSVKMPWEPKFSSGPLEAPTIAHN